MPRARVSPAIELEYESFGDERDPLLVLVMGFTLQLTAWDVRFCEAIASRGLRVVRFDNRDVGRSTKLSAAGIPDFFRALSDRSVAPYRIEDMADDVLGLVGALGAPAAHLVGVSMGGFIVQEAALRDPARVRSLTSMMSSTGDRRVGRARPETMAALMAPPPSEREAVLDHAVRLWRAIGSPGFPFDEERVRARAGLAWDRDPDVTGIARQAAAVLSQRDRTAALAGVQAPATVIHGAADPVIDVSGGEATARAISGARLLVIPGMGHDLPEALWPTFVDAIVDNARRAVA